MTFLNKLLGRRTAAEITWTGSKWRAHVWTRKGYSSATFLYHPDAREWAEETARSEA